MESDLIKDEIIRQVLTGCTPYMDDSQRKTLELQMIMALHDVTVSKEETSLSTEFAASNEDYLKQFLGIKMVKGLTPRSLKRYSEAIRKFFAYIEKPVPDVTANDIRYFMAIRKQRDGITNVTLNGELLCLRSFFSTLAVEEIIHRNPTAKIDRVKTEKRVKSPFTELEVERLRQACLNSRNKMTNVKRNLAIVEVLYSTGCRVSELVGLKRSDIDGERVKALGKGNKERFVYLNPRAQIALNNYLSTRTDSFDWVFPGGVFAATGKNEVVDKPIDIGTVESMIRELGKRAGVENCHPHRFRRTAATIALRRGMPIEQVSKMLGHEQLTTTQIYAITADEDVQNAHRKYLT